MTTQPPTMNLSTLKTKQSQMWETGDYSIPGGSLSVIAENLCEAVELHSGQKVLDVATGTGNTAIAAARRHCEVTGVDFAPALLERARERAAVEHLSITFLEADAEQLPFPSASFDVVLSTLGVIFAPDQEKAARELLRVCRPGGKIGLANWIPTGSFAYTGQIMAKYAPPPPPGIKPPGLWGTETRLRELFGDEITDLQTTTRCFYHRYRSAQHALEVLGTNFGPIATALRSLNPERRQLLAQDMIAAYEKFNQATDGTLVMPAEYLEVVAIRR